MAKHSTNRFPDTYLKMFNIKSEMIEKEIKPEIIEKETTEINDEQNSLVNLLYTICIRLTNIEYTLNEIKINTSKKPSPKKRTKKEPNAKEESPK